MKVIFLDMDGVLCTIRAHIGQNAPRGLMTVLDREGIGLLNRLTRLDGAEVRVVLSSTWRLIKTRDWMERHLRSFGWEGNFHEDWQTPDFPCRARGFEINDWLCKHPEIIEYLILDDDGDMLPEQIRHFVHTHPYDGISYDNFIQASRILLGENHGT